MAKADFLKTDESGRADQFVLFRDNITPYLATLELLNGAVPHGEITQQAADATYFRAVVDFSGTMQQAAQGWTAWKNFIGDGGTGSPLNPIVPTLPAGFPVAPAPGIFVRFRVLVKRLKSHKNYTTAIGQILGIEGVESTSPDFATLKPVLTLRLNGGMLEIPWGWQGHYNDLDAIEILVDRSDSKGFVPLTIDTTAGYTDSAAHPFAPTKWTYKAIYRLGDNRVGQWSDEVSVNVGG